MGESTPPTAYCFAYRCHGCAGDLSSDVGVLSVDTHVTEGDFTFDVAP